MDEAALNALLKTTGLPVAYHHYVTPPKPPYIVYLLDDADAWGSDERNRLLRIGYLVELYTTKKEPSTQRLIESLFDERGIEYGLTETFIESEGLFQSAYSIEFTEKIRRT